MGQGRDLVDSSVKTWNDHSFEAWAANFSDDAVFAAPGGVTGSGPQATKLFYSMWQDAFSDNQIRDVRIAEDGENVYLEAVFDGTHTASLKRTQRGGSGDRQARQHPVRDEIHLPGRAVHRVPPVLRPDGSRHAAPAVGGRRVAESAPGGRLAGRMSPISSRPGSGSPRRRSCRSER